MTPIQKLPRNVRDLGKLIVAKGFKSCPKANKLPNLVTLVKIDQMDTYFKVRIRERGTDGQADQHREREKKECELNKC